MSRVADPKAKNALLRAAEQAFANRGVAGAKVEDITREAGLSKGAFYLHFESKEAALKQIVETWLARCKSLFAGPSDYPDAPADPDSVLDFVIERDVQLYEFLWRSRTTMRVLEGCHGEYGYMFEAFREDMRRRTRAWLDWWQQDGLIRPEVDIELAGMLVSGAHEQLASRITQSEERPPIERWLELTQELFSRALGTPELVAALQRRSRRTTTGVHEVRPGPAAFGALDVVSSVVRAAQARETS